MTIRYDGHGAVITETVHELEAYRVWPQTLESPGEAWARCTCGEEMESQGSAGGPEQSVGEMFALHLDEVAADEGADCGETA
ncbi:hypothetical protein ACIGH6_14360 [Brachybacterium paraconglomeratum]|uniref:hypothetical protein n=1 Tax=Brachybacterium paraconglomeratum TaxID=173362 RepID=UPI0037C8400B